MLALSLVYFGTATYGVVYFLPQIIKGWGLSNLQTGFVASVPDIVGTIGMLMWGTSPTIRPSGAALWRCAASDRRLACSVRPPGR